MAETLSYEEAREELVAVVQKLETGGTSLQESIELWERGEELARICQRWLDGARARLDAVVRGAAPSPPEDPAGYPKNPASDTPEGSARLASTDAPGAAPADAARDAPDNPMRDSSND